MAQRCTEISGCENTTGRPRLDEPHGIEHCCFTTNGAALGCHHQRCRSRAGLFQRSDQLFKIAANGGAYVGIRRGRARALVLSDIRDDVRGYRHSDAGCLLFENARNCLLVQRIAIGMQQAHGDGLHALLYELVGGATYLAFVQRNDHSTLGIEALVNLESQ